MEHAVVIDGDILESRFEVNPHSYERFSHIILCSEDLRESHAVPYAYVRAMGNVVSYAAVRDVEDRTTEEGIEWYTVSTDGKVLVFSGTSVRVVYGMVQRLMGEIQAICNELIAFREMGLSGGNHGFRLLSYLKSISLADYQGEGVFWLPENYAEERPGEVDGETDDEQHYRVLICAQIKHRPLPMTHLVPLSDEDRVTMAQVLEFLSNEEILSKLYCTHYAVMFKDSRHIAREVLHTLMADEFRCVKNELPISPESSFIFTNEHLDALRVTHPTETAHDLLRYYVGDYLDELDLSRCYITGSAMAACLLINSTFEEAGPETNIDIHYPPVYTEVPQHGVQMLRQDNIGTWNMRMTSETEGVATKNGATVPFLVRPGADVDIAVDNTVTDDDYRAIVAAHFETIKKYYPAVAIREYTKPKGDWNYVIYMTDLTLVPYFRTIEIYRSSFRNICSHHVGAVRAAYTARWNHASQHQNHASPRFYCTASAIWTFKEKKTPNYHYFAGRKSNPQDVIIKYQMRGIGVSDQVLDRIIQEYIQNKHINIASLPFYTARNVPYSLFSAVHEYQHRPQPRRRDNPVQRQREQQQEAMLGLFNLIGRFTDYQ